ncbi:hypothetical protein E4U13_005542 [Claviceps humidiphila]|uniref:Glycosyl transferase family 25 domain-containing protein n=2 Tax=Claviceps TaxID=5110 RepID=A0A9P7Q084_9HYPO|nr:hypothetical protein E4U57_003941 [Claviceps arundinis]KAG6088400.1 hypothetical protein E4U15_006169 [Claviceps sp. LM218 group G6]KAG6094432.1 hypothetical protein E4U30_003353 [Claviceps sp. LM220 group G6]KAG6104743.1 hypothetical protein E4U31_001826 [Claviceps sp. LM219 group G6]KAG6108446.1 hypothetical protein E4U14_003661 [Claviceps sp. LM454 group G7]KAG6110115.1 hypothetical protein E4U13_005542 [Claviceps humidiphila]
MRSQTRVQFIGVAAIFCTFLLVHQWLYRYQNSFGLLADKSAWRLPRLGDISKAAQNATLGFEKVFYISLPNRSDRQDIMSMLASSTNVSLTFQPGASGADIPAKAKPAGSDGLRDGQLGCWRSHADVWKRIIDENIQTAIVVEDDADWDMDIHNIFERLSQHMKKTKLGKHTRTPYELKHAPYGLEWDLLYIGSCWDIPRKEKPHKHETYEDPSAPNSNEMSGAYAQQLRDWGISVNEDTHIRALAPSWYSVCTIGYAVTLHGARKLLYTVGNGEGLAGPVDLAMINAVQKGQISALTVVPPFVVPWKKGTATDSDINEPPKEGEEHKQEPSGSENMKKSGRKTMQTLLGGQRSRYENDLA